MIKDMSLVFHHCVPLTAPCYYSWGQEALLET